MLKNELLGNPDYRIGTPSFGLFIAGFYNCLLRQVENEVLPCCRRLGMAFYAYSPLASGLLGGNPRHSFASVMGGQAYSAGRSSDPEVLEQAVACIAAACERSGVEIRQAAFRWLFNHSDLARGDGVITGICQCLDALL